MLKSQINLINAHKKILLIFASNLVLIKFFSNGLGQLDTNPNFLQNSWSKFKCTLIKNILGKILGRKEMKILKLCALKEKKFTRKKLAAKFLLKIGYLLGLISTKN